MATDLLLPGDTNFPRRADEYHQHSDVDSSAFAQHHTLGPKVHQAAPGNHKHTKATLRLITRNATLNSALPQGTVFAIGATNVALYTSANIVLDAASELVFIHANPGGRSTANCAGFWYLQVWHADTGWVEVCSTRFHNSGDASQSFNKELSGWFDLVGLSNQTIQVRVLCSVDAGSSAGVTTNAGDIYVTNFKVV